MMVIRAKETAVDALRVILHSYVCRCNNDDVIFIIWAIVLTGYKFTTLFKPYYKIMLT